MGSKHLPLLAVLLSASTVVLAAWPRTEAAAPAPPPPSEQRPDEALDLLGRRLDAVDDDQRALWNRLLELERRTATASMTTDGGATAAPALVSEVTQLKQELRALMQGEVLSDEAGRHAMKALVREVEADLSRERLAQRQVRQEQREAERQARWKSFITSARLTFEQERTLTERFAAEESSRKALFAQGGAGGRDALRALRDQRQETDEMMRPLLDASQRQQYEALRREEPGGGSGARRPRERDDATPHGEAEGARPWGAPLALTHGPTGTGGRRSE
jgi:hypothetical protein